MRYYEDPILGKGRAADVSGGTGGSGTTYIGGFAIGIFGDTISRLRYMPIESVTGNSVTLQAGHAYKAYATSTAITLNTETVPEGQFGLEGHIEIYVAGTGYVVTGTNVVLANALEPDSVNNCTLRFHDGVCIISVEDHVAGYIVVNGATSGSGSLAYGIATSTNDYVAFDASLNGTTIPLAGAVAEGEKHVVGNGYTETAITGAVDCGTSKFTVANLGLNNVQVTGGTMALGDVYIPSGSTVAVSGGNLAVEQVSGSGTINLNGTYAVAAGNAKISDVTFTNGGGGVAVTPTYANNCVFDNCVFSGNINGDGTGGGGRVVFGSAQMSSCSLLANNAGQGGGFFVNSGTLDMSSCTVSGNTAYYGGGLRMVGTAIVRITDCTINGNATTGQGKDFYIDGGTTSVGGCIIGSGVMAGGIVVFSGSNTIDMVSSVGDGGSATISSGASINLTSSIAPGGGVTFAKGGATIIPGGTASLAYMLGGMTVLQIGNTNVVNLSGANIAITSGSAYASGCTFTGGSASEVGGAFLLDGNSLLTLEKVTFSGNTTGSGKGMAIATNGGTVSLLSCTFEESQDVRTTWSAGAEITASDTTLQLVSLNFATDNLTLGGTCSVVNVGGSGTAIISSGASINLTSSIAPGGGITVLEGGCTVNGVTVEPDTYTSFVVSGGTTYINQ